MKKKGKKQKEELSCPPPLLDASLPLEEETRSCVTSALNNDKNASSHKNKHDEHCDCFGSMPVLEPIYGSNLQQAVVQNSSEKLTSCAKSTSSSGRSTPSCSEQTNTKVPQNSNDSKLDKNKSDAAIYSSVISALKSVSSTPPSSPIPLVCLKKVKESCLASNSTTSDELISDSNYLKAESPALAKMHGKVIKGISIKTFKNRPKDKESSEMSHEQAVQISNSDTASNSALEVLGSEQVKSKVKTPKNTPKKKKRKFEKEQDGLDDIDIKKSASESCVTPTKKEKKRKIDTIATSKLNSGDHTKHETPKKEQSESPKSCGDGNILDTPKTLGSHQSQKCSGNIKSSPKKQKQKSPSPKRAYKIKTSEAEVLENMKQRKLHKLQQIQDISPSKEVGSNEQLIPQEGEEDLSHRSETATVVDSEKSAISAKSGKKKQSKNKESLVGKSKVKKQDKVFAVKNGKMVLQGTNAIDSLMVFDGKKTVKYKTFLSGLHTDGDTETSQNQAKTVTKDTKKGKKKKSLPKIATESEIPDIMTTSCHENENQSDKKSIEKTDICEDIVSNPQLSVNVKPDDNAVSTPLQIDASPYSSFFDSRLSSPDSEEKKISPHVTRSGRVASRIVLSSPVRRERLTKSENSSPEKYEYLKSPSVETCSVKSKEAKVSKNEKNNTSLTTNKHSIPVTPQGEEFVKSSGLNVGKRTPKKKLGSATKKKKCEESEMKSEINPINVKIGCEPKSESVESSKKKKSISQLTTRKSEEKMSPLKETADEKMKKLKISKPDHSFDEKNVETLENEILPSKSEKKSPKKPTKLSPSPKKVKGKKINKNDQTSDFEAATTSVEALNQDNQTTDLVESPTKINKTRTPKGKQMIKKNDSSIIAKESNSKPDQSFEEKNAESLENEILPFKAGKKSPKKITKLSPSSKKKKKSPFKDESLVKNIDANDDVFPESNEKTVQNSDNENIEKTQEKVPEEGTVEEKSKKESDLEVEKASLAKKPDPLARLISEMKVRLSTDESVSMSGESEQEFSSSEEEEEESSSEEEDSSENKEDTSFDTSTSSIDNSPEKKEQVKGSPRKKISSSQFVSDVQNPKDKEERLDSVPSVNTEKEHTESVNKTPQVKDFSVEKDTEIMQKQLQPSASSNDIPSPSTTDMKSSNVNKQEKSCTVVTSDVVESHFARTFNNLVKKGEQSEEKIKTLEALALPKVETVTIKIEPGVHDMEKDAKDKEAILEQNKMTNGLKPKEEKPCITDENVHKIFEKPVQKKSSAFVSSELDDYLNENREINSQFICTENFDGGETAHVSEVDPVNMGQEQHDMDEVDGIVFLSFGSQTSMELYEEKHKVKVEEDIDEFDLDKTDDVKKIKGWKKKYGKQEEECLQLHWKALEKLVKPVCQDEMEVLGLTLRKSGKKWSCYSRKYEKKYKEKDYGKYIEPFDKDGLTEGYRGSVQRIYGRKSDGKFASKNTIKQRVSPKYGTGSMKQTLYGKHEKYSPESKKTRDELIEEHIKKGYGKERILMKSPKGRIRSLKVRGRKRYIKTPPHLRPVTLTQSMAEMAASAFSLTGKTRPYSVRRKSCEEVLKKEMFDNENTTQEEKDTENVTIDESKIVIGPTDQQTPESGCSKDFCRLGCVCESIEAKTLTPEKAEKDHCGKPGCMLGCVCHEEEKEEKVEDTNVRKSKRLKNVRRLTQIDALNSLVFFDTSYWLGDKPRKKIKPEQARLLEKEKRIGLEELQKVSKEAPMGEEPEILLPLLAETKGQAELDKKGLNFEDDDEEEVEGLAYTFDEEEENTEDCARSSIYITRQRNDSDSVERNTWISPMKDTRFQDSPTQVDVEPAPKSKRGRKKKIKIPFDLMTPSTSKTFKVVYDKTRPETTYTNDSDCIIIDDDEEIGNDGELSKNEEVMTASRQQDTDNSKVNTSDELDSEKTEKHEIHANVQDLDENNSLMRRKSDSEQPNNSDQRQINFSNLSESDKGSTSKNETNYLSKNSHDKMMLKKGHFKTQMVLLQRKMKRQIGLEGKPDTSEMSLAAKEAIKRLQCAINATSYSKETGKDKSEDMPVKKDGENKETCSDEVMHSMDKDNCKDDQNQAVIVSSATEQSTEKESSQEETTKDQDKIERKSDDMQDTSAKIGTNDTKSSETSDVSQEIDKDSALEKKDETKIIPKEKVLDVNKSEDSKVVSGEYSSSPVAKKSEDNKNESDDKCIASVSNITQEDMDKSSKEEQSIENAQTAQKSLPKESETNPSNSPESGDISCQKMPANEKNIQENPPQEKSSNPETDKKDTSPSKENDSSALSDDDQLRNIPHLLEIKSNCNWEKSRTEILGKISFICDWCDYPRPSFFKVKGFVVKILPKPTKLTPIPKSLQSKLKATETYTIRVLIVKEGSNETETGTNESQKFQRDRAYKQQQNTDESGGINIQDVNSSDVLERNTTETGGKSDDVKDISSGISGFGKFVVNIAGNVIPQTDTNDVMHANKKKRGRPPGKTSNSSKKKKLCANTTDMIQEGKDAVGSKSDTSSKKKGVIATLTKSNDGSSPSLPLLPQKTGNGIPSAVSTVRVPLKWLQENMKLAAKGMNPASNLVVTGTRGQDGGEIQAMAEFVSTSPNDKIIEPSSEPMNYSPVVYDSELDEPMNLVKREMKDTPKSPLIENNVDKTVSSKMDAQSEEEEIEIEDEEPIQSVSPDACRNTDIILCATKKPTIENVTTKEKNPSDDEEDVDIVSSWDSTGSSGLCPLRPENITRDVKMVMDDHLYIHSPGPQMNWGSKLKLQESSSEPMSPSSSTSSSSMRLALHSKREKVRRHNLKTLFENLRELVLQDETADPNKCPKILILKTAIEKITELHKNEESLISAKEDLKRTKLDLERRISILEDKKPRITVRLLKKPQASDNVSSNDSVHCDLSGCESDMPDKTNSSSVNCESEISNIDTQIQQVKGPEMKLESLDPRDNTLDSFRDMSDKDDCDDELGQPENKPEDSDAPLGLVIEKVESLQNSAFDMDQDIDQGNE